MVSPIGRIIGVVAGERAFAGQRPEFLAFSYKNFDKIRDAYNLGAGGKATQLDILDRLDKFGREILRPALLAHTPSGATGMLAATTGSQVRPSGSPDKSNAYHEWTLIMSQDPRNMYGNVYSGYVVSGRYAGNRPPVAAILPWVMAMYGLVGRDARSAAFAVATNIGKRGKRPNTYMQQTVIAVSSDIDQLGQDLAMTVVARVHSQIPTPTMTPVEI